MIESAIYEGTLWHRRLAVRRREFGYRVAMLLVDLDELPDLLGGALLARRPGLVRFRREDYLGDPGMPLSDAVRDTIEAHSGRRPRGPVRVLTHPRMYGHCFNPVSFYFCAAPGGQGIEAVVAEVTNTPWGERASYTIAAPAPEDASPLLAGRSLKRLHVSPFMGMDQHYEWQASAPGSSLSVRVDSHEGERVVFQAGLDLRRRPLTRRSLADVTLRYPFATLRLLALIYAHGAALALRRVPYHAHPSKRA